MSTRGFPCHYTVVRKEAERRTAHRKKDSPGQLFTVFVRAVSPLLLAGTFHEHLLPISIHQAAPLPSHGFLSRFSLHLPTCTPYLRLQNLTRPRNASVHSRSPIAVATSFRGSQSPGSKEAIFQSWLLATARACFSGRCRVPPTTPGSTDNPFDRTNRRELGRSTFVDAVTHRLCIAAAFHVKLTCPMRARSQPKCMQNHECQVGMSLAAAGSLEIAAAQARSWKKQYLALLPSNYS